MRFLLVSKVLNLNHAFQTGWRQSGTGYEVDSISGVDNKSIKLQCWSTTALRAPKLGNMLWFSVTIRVICA